jgi:hypothetical protein
MKAISLWQPWASFMFAGLPFPPKTVETRSRRILGKHRGDIAIHAVKREPTWVVDEFLWDTYLMCLVHDFLEEFAPGAPAEEILDALPRGCVLGIVDAYEQVATDHVDFAKLPPQERYLGNFDRGRVAIATRNPVRLPTPVPYRGAQGLWTLPDGVCGVGPAEWPEGR